MKRTRSGASEGIIPPGMAGERRGRSEKSLPKQPSAARRPGDAELEAAAREEQRKVENLARIEANNRTPTPRDAKGNRLELPSAINKLTPEEIRRRERTYSNASAGIVRSFEPRDSNQPADIYRPDDMPVNQQPEMTLEEAMRLDAEGKLPVGRGGRPRAILTSDGWYTPRNLAPKPPADALLSTEAARIRRAKNR